MGSGRVELLQACYTAGMSETPPSAVPLPRSVRWFAPWTWRRSWLAVAVGIMLAAYALSPLPMLYAAKRMNTDGVIFRRVYYTVYYPLMWSSRQSQLVDELYRDYWRILNYGSEAGHEWDF